MNTPTESDTLYSFSFSSCLLTGPTEVDEIVEVKIYPPPPPLPSARFCITCVETRLIEEKKAPKLDTFSGKENPKPHP